jgi:predicted RNA binding protein YcfA (HicA-like mRNA interferase family)
VVAIVTSLGFKLNRQKGSHAHYERAADQTLPRSIVTVDMAISSFGEDLMKSMIRQSNHTREAFYGATEKTKKKL